MRQAKAFLEAEGQGWCGVKDVSELIRGYHPDARGLVSTEYGSKGMAGPLQAELLKGAEG